MSSKYTAETILANNFLFRPVWSCPVPGNLVITRTERFRVQVDIYQNKYYVKYELSWYVFHIEQGEADQKNYKAKRALKIVKLTTMNSNIWFELVDG